MSTTLQQLLARDPVLRPVIEGGPAPGRSRDTDIYRSLLQAIVAQQLSARAADTICARFFALFADGYPHPQHVLRKRDETLRSAGLSRQKARYVKNVARFELRQGMAAAKLRRMSEEDVIAYLTPITGVGRWTVEMLLIFPLNRPDVLPVDDLGIQRAMKKLYRLRSSGPRLRQRMTAIAEAWRPHRSLVCKYLWRSGL